MINKLTVIVFIFLGFVAVFCNVQSCAHNKTQILKFVKPPSEAKIWQKNFVEWENLPVKVRVHGDMWQMVASDTARSIDAWNVAIGCTVLKLSWSEAAEIVVSMTPQPEGETWAGSAKFVPRTDKKGDKYWGSNIFVYVLYLNDRAARDNLMSHEIGHALGLDDLEKGKHQLMYKNISDGMHVDKEALSALNHIYCDEE